MKIYILLKKEYFLFSEEFQYIIFGIFDSEEKAKKYIDSDQFTIEEYDLNKIKDKRK